MTSKKIILLAGKNLSTNIVFNSLNDKFGVSLAIIENKESKKVFIKRRIKRLGMLTALGQIAFQLFVAKPLGYFSHKQIKTILKDNKLNTDEINNSKVKVVSSINSSETIALLKEINPDLIIVNGTRIISKKVISSVSCRLINTHAGITPKYRGVHGTYWALVNNDIGNSGVTVHFVDEGIDTGNIIAQAQVIPGKKDNFATYPYLQLATGITLLHKAVTDYFDGNVNIRESEHESYLWYHPTLWQYIYYRIFRKIK